MNTAESTGLTTPQSHAEAFDELIKTVNEPEQVDRAREMGVEDAARDVEHLVQLGVGSPVDDRRAAPLRVDDAPPAKDGELL